jgi:hypothetical protein
MRRHWIMRKYGKTNFSKYGERQFNREHVLESFPTHFCIAPSTRNETNHEMMRRIFPPSVHAVDCFTGGSLSSLGLAASGFSTSRLESATSCVFGEVGLTTGAWPLEAASSTTSSGVTTASVGISGIIVEGHIATTVGVRTGSTLFHGNLLGTNSVRVGSNRGSVPSRVGKFYKGTVLHCQSNNPCTHDRILLTRCRETSKYLSSPKLSKTSRRIRASTFSFTFLI